MRELRRRIGELGLTNYQVWLRYVSFGGRADLFEFEAYLEEVLTAEAFELALIAHALWEMGAFGTD